MSLYLEIPKLNSLFPFRTFLNDGWGVVYPHWHKEVEFIYCLKGTVNLGAYEKIVRLEEGEIYFFPSGEPHFFLASPDSERIVYQFDLKLFRENANLQGTDRSLTQLYNAVVNHSSDWPVPLQNQLRELLLSIFAESQSQQEGMQYGITGMLFQITQLFYQLPTKTSESQGNPNKILRNKETLNLLNQTFTYVEDHYLDTITLQDVAEQIGFSPNYFSRFFKKNFGVHFMQYLTEFRINQAKYLLSTEDLSMTEVAIQSGFASVKTFHHVFKAQVGCSPLQYQKKVVHNEVP